MALSLASSVTEHLVSNDIVAKTRKVDRWEELVHLVIIGLSYPKSGKLMLVRFLILSEIWSSKTFFLKFTF